MVENTVEAQPPPSRLVWALATVATLFMLIAAAVSFLDFRKPPEPRVITTSIVAPENTTFSFDRACPPALSPDGRRIVFPARAADSSTQLGVRALNSSSAQPLAGTGGATLLPGRQMAARSHTTGRESARRLRNIPLQYGQDARLGEFPDQHRPSKAPRSKPSGDIGLESKHRLRVPVLHREGLPTLDHIPERCVPAISKEFEQRHRVGLTHSSRLPDDAT